VAHGTEGLEDYLRLGIESHDQFRIVITPKFAKEGKVHELGIGKSIRSGIEGLAAFFDIVNGNDQILSLKIGQKAQTTGSGTDDTFNAIRQLDLSPSCIDYYSFARVRDQGDPEKS
jgi:hypothetical protein